MSYTEYVEPSYISYHTYENEINDKQQEIDKLQEEHFEEICKKEKAEDELKEAKDIINTLKKEIKRYEKIIRENNISL